MLDLLEGILNKPDSTIAFAAVIISMISLLLSIISAGQNRRNNRLSVRPICYILPPDYDNRIAVIIQNKGTGPLITKKIEFKKGETESKSYLIDYMPSLENGYYWSTFSKASKIVLRPSEEKILLEFKGDPAEEDFIRQRDRIREELSKIQINISYTSIFNEWCPFKLNYNLTWFAIKN